MALLCPLRFNVHTDVAHQESTTQDCREEKCAWWINVEKDLGQSGCALSAMGSAIMAKVISS